MRLWRVLLSMRAGKEQSRGDTSQQRYGFSAPALRPDGRARQCRDTLADLRTAKDGEDVSAIQQKTQALLQTSMKLGEAMYKAQQEKEAAAANPSDKDGSGPGAGAAGPGAKDEKVVDADYEEVDEKNKKKSA